MFLGSRALSLTRMATGGIPEVAPGKDYALALPAHGIASLVAGRNFSNYWLRKAAVYSAHVGRLDMSAP